MERTTEIKGFPERLCELLGVKLGQPFNINKGMGLWYRIVYIPTENLPVALQTYNTYEQRWNESKVSLSAIMCCVVKNGITIEDELRKGDTIYIPNLGVPKGYNKYTYDENDIVCQRLTEAGMLFTEPEDAKQYANEILGVEIDD